MHFKKYFILIQGSIHFLKLILVNTLFIFIVACTKSKIPQPTIVTPSNLIITATVSQDGTGRVDFKASADNANFYKFEFGNGDIKDAPNGLISYTYNKVGTLTYTIKVTAFSISGKTITATTDINVTVSSTSLLLTWFDEFSNTGSPDVNKWTYDIGTGIGGWGNNELQYYTNRLENAFCENGILKIKAIKENYSGSAYTSARLVSRGKFDFKYGRVEVKAKLPTGAGTWPAIWMLGSNMPSVGWPACGEIDIMEHRGSEINKIHTSLHYPGRSGGNPVTNTKVISNATTEFHLYRVDWNSTSIEFYIDNQVVFTVANNPSIPFNHPFYLLLNIAMGGNFGGNIDSSFTSSIMEIDYIRVYQ